ncbi:uncharacterized protein LOC141730449 [Zonotrichia albicollis]|uniref:uncharacterized protein LOC141730449 n=1 Tax=Zonotrichia albicollis TaxID=44394 RepID=UPI003D80F41E
MPPVEEEKPESIVLKKISAEKSLHVKGKVSPKETVPAIEPLEYKISVETAGEILNSETEEQEKVSLKYFVLASEEEEPGMTPVVSGKTALTGEKLKVEMDHHITYSKGELPLPDEEVKLISITSEQVERDSGEEKEDEIKLLVQKEDAIEKVSEKLSVLHEGEIPSHEKEEIESTCVPKPRKPDQPRDQKGLLGKEKKTKKGLQPEKFHIKDKTSFVQDIIEADIAETSQLRNENERGGFTQEKDEIPLSESMKGHGIQGNIQRLKQSGSTVPGIAIDRSLNKEAKKIEDIQGDEKDMNLDFTSAEVHSLDLSEETQPELRKDVDLEHPTEDEEVPGEKHHTVFKPSVVKSEEIEIKVREKCSTEKEPHYEESLGQLLTEKALLSDKKTGKKILPEKEEKTIFSTHLKGEIRLSNTPESLPVEKEFDTVITGGMESEVSTGEHQKGIICESVKKVAIQPPQSQDEKQIQEVHTIPDEHKETLANKSRKGKIEEKQSTEGISDEKASPEHGIGKSTSGTMKKEKGKLIDKVSSSKGILANGEDTHSSSIGKAITSKKAEGEKEYQKSEPAHLTEQATRLESENKNLDAPGESHEALEVPAKSRAKRGEED